MNRIIQNSPKGIAGVHDVSPGSGFAHAAPTIVCLLSEGLSGNWPRIKQATSTAMALAGRGCEVHLLVGRERRLAGDRAQLQTRLSCVPGLRLHEIPMLRGRWTWNGLFHLCALARLILLVRRRDRAVVYVRHLKLAAWLLRFRRMIRRPIIFEVHDLMHRVKLEKHGKKKASSARRLRRLEGRVYAGADALVCVSRGAAIQVDGTFAPRAPLRIVPNGVGLEDFPRRTAIARSREVCYVGSVAPWKNVEVLVAAMGHLPEASLTVVGGGSGPDDLERLKWVASESGAADRVRLLGPLGPEEAKEHLYRARVAAIPLAGTGHFQHSTSPIKLFEYMASGTPVVASDLPALREILTDGENALLVTPDDPAALADGLRRVLDDEALARRLAERAYEDVQRYTWDARASAIAAFASEVLEAGGG